MTRISGLKVGVIYTIINHEKRHSKYTIDQIGQLKILGNDSETWHNSPMGYNLVIDAIFEEIK